MSDIFDAPRKLTKKVFGDDVGSFLSDPANIFGERKGMFGGVLSKALEGATPAAAPEPPPTLITPAAMPTPNSGEQRQARRKSYAQQLARKGRASTILTAADEADSLGA